MDGATANKDGIGKELGRAIKNDSCLDARINVPDGVQSIRRKDEVYHDPKEMGMANCVKGASEVYVQSINITVGGPSVF